MKAIASILIAGIAFVATPAFAQDKPAEKPATTEAKATTPAAPETKAPTVPEDAKKLLADLQAADAGYARSIAVLQKERDALSAEFTRAIGRLQVPGYDLTPALTYVKKDDTKK